MIIAGGRDFESSSDYLFRIDKILSKWAAPHGEIPMFKDLEMVTGTAKGADQIPYYYESWHGVPIKEFPANWDKFGKSAGYIRNAEMADYADALIAFWDGKSRGTKNMIDIATKKGLKVRVIRYEN